MATNRDRLKAVKQSEKSKFLERIPAAMRSMYHKVADKISNKTSYTPHQGEQECARRRRQIERGFLKT